MSCCATIGFFDGVHLGHQSLLRQLRDEAIRGGLAPIAITFAEHPRKILQPHFRPRLLTTLAEKRGFIEECGIAKCEVLHFTPALARLTAREFMESHLRPLGVTRLMVGYDHRFGSDRCAFAECAAQGEALGIRVVRAEAFRAGDKPVSSSAIRDLLDEGDAATAAACLGRYYQVSGTVVEGKQVGRQIGFPTANLRPDAPEKLIPACGSYAVWAQTGGRTYPAMTNIGRRPTLADGGGVSIETHLIGLEGSIYGQPLTLQFVRRLRAERQFPSLEELQRQLRADAAATKEILNSNETFC